ncbi:hypothetical protein E1181_08870 [Saccharopolyspora terrae]|uniref:Uncharacterized protein n=1 Tax=Saccharopolyspora terrae TaxID=2530384 RepID=A0A4R4VY97_9PSEU|nr:hypothetical protein [Saccharopolyspora terrae]TDD07894.1 hypothetical protein E1181_08870 [Saccharopolyspora terrae]
MPSWDPAEAEQVTSEAQLREVVEPPFPEIAEKAVSGNDDVSRRFIERSRLFFVAMADLALKGVPPALAVVVNVEELFVHCGRALLKYGVWRVRDLAGGRAARRDGALRIPAGAHTSGVTLRAGTTGTASSAKHPATAKAIG